MKKRKWYVSIFNRLFNYKVEIGIIFVFTILAAVLTSFVPSIVGNIVDIVLIDSDIRNLNLYTTYLFVILVIGNLFVAVRQYLSVSVTTKLTNELSKELFNKIIRTKYPFFTDTRQGDILQRIAKDVKALQNFELDIIPNFCYEVVLSVLAMISVLRIYWPLGIIGMMIYSVYLFPTRYMGEVLKRKSGELRNQSALLKQMVVEKMKSIDQIKIYGTEEEESVEIREEQNRWGKLLQSKYMIDQTYRMFPRVLDALIPALVFLIGGWQFFIGNLSIGNLVAITGFLPYVNAPIKSFASTFFSLKDVAVQMEKVVEYLELPMEKGITEDMEHVSTILGKIEFKDVSVINDRGVILDHVSFVINPGESVALVGPTGSGKSTILKLIIRLIEPTSGEIFIDGRPLNRLNASDIRKRTGNLLQDTFLFDDSIESNLRYLNKSISESEKEELIKKVGLREAISELPEGYNSSVGENGVILSGGQKQRLGIVRVLLKQMDILLMDEATSALDRQNEIAVHNIIREITKHKTCIFAAHRIETVVDADNIFAFKLGKIVESGTHDELLKQAGYYSKLWSENSQMEER
jgi:ABC-type multidrug transport system fused ATPase/permease subunit